MSRNRRGAFWWCWLAGTLVWVPWEAGRIGLYHFRWLPAWSPTSGLQLPDQSYPAGMPDLPGTTLYAAVQDLFLPPMIVLLAGVIIGWILKGRWKA